MKDKVNLKKIGKVALAFVIGMFGSFFMSNLMIIVPIVYIVGYFTAKSNFNYITFALLVACVFSITTYYGGDDSGETASLLQKNTMTINA